jgi:hypothetical protein
VNVPTSLDVEELFYALLIIIHELSQVMQLFNQFGLLIYILSSRDFWLIVLLRFLLAVFFQLSLEDLHLSLEFIQ